MKRQLIIAAVLFAICVQTESNSAPVKTVESLKLFCSQNSSEDGCWAYIQGVYDSFFLISEYSRMKGEGTEYMCEKVGKEDMDLLVSIVKSRMSRMEKGFAAFRINEVINEILCK
jgi:hypothetical protein